MRVGGIGGGGWSFGFFFCKRGKREGIVEVQGKREMERWFVLKRDADYVAVK